MGVVMRQGMKYTVVTYAFMIFSIVASLFLFPLDVDLYGTFKFFVDTTSLILPFVLLGVTLVSVRYFPKFEKGVDRNSLLTNSAFIIVSLGIIFLATIGIIFKDDLAELYVDKSKIIKISDYLWIFIPLAFLMALYRFLIVQISNYKRIALPSLVQNSWRVSLPIIFSLVFFKVISIQVGLLLLLFHYFLCLFVLLFVLNRLSRLKIIPLKKVFGFLKRKDVQTYGVYATITALGTNIAFKLDVLMLTTLLDTTNTGIYSIGNHIGSIIGVPAAAIMAIGGPVISQALKNNDREQVQSVYSRSSDILTIAGIFLTAGLSVIVFDLFSIMHEGEKLIQNGAIFVVACIASVKLFDMITSINGHIISFSDFFKYNLYFLSLLAVLNIILNFIFIPKLGIKGAALSTLISLSLFNVLKLFFIKKYMKYWPFSWRTLLIVLIGGLAVSITFIVASWFDLPRVFAIFFKGSLVVLLIFVALYIPKISPDFNRVVDTSRTKLLSILRLK